MGKNSSIKFTICRRLLRFPPCAFLFPSALHFSVPPSLHCVGIFDIIAPPLAFAKIVPKWHLADTWGLFYSYIGHICNKCSIYLTNISPIYHKSQGHISVIWIWEKCEKFRPPPPLVKVVYIWNVDFFDFGFAPPPPYGLFPQFGTFSFWHGPLITWL